MNDFSREHIGKLIVEFINKTWRRPKIEELVYIINHEFDESEYSSYEDIFKNIMSEESLKKYLIEYKLDELVSCE